MAWSTTSPTRPSPAPDTQRWANARSVRAFVRHHLESVVAVLGAMLARRSEHLDRCGRRS